MDGNALVSFDLLKMWALDAFGREAGDTEPLGCGWASLANALHFVGVLGSEPQKELRAHLVHQYCRIPADGLNEIFEAKREDRLSFFNLAGYAKEEVEPHWTWYLHCLSFSKSEVEEHIGEGIAFMPLDTVDLMLVACTLKVRITVSRLVEETLRFQPPLGEASVASVHLLLRQIDRTAALWAPLLRLRRPETEPVSLVGAVVELGRFRVGGPLEIASQKTASILSFDAASESYEACIDGVSFRVKRNQILRIVLHENSILGDSAESTSLGDSVTPGTQNRRGDGTEKFGKPIAGIPDCALEFQTLHHLVRQVGAEKLPSLSKELAGRASSPLAPSGAGGEWHHRPPAATQNTANGGDTQPGTFTAEGYAPAPVAPRQQIPRPLETLLHRLVGGRSTSSNACSIIAPRDFAGAQHNLLSFKQFDAISVTHYDQKERRVYGQLNRISRWFPLDCIVVWKVVQEFQGNSEYLTLEKDDLYYMEVIYKGDHSHLGWASLVTDPNRKGYVCLANLAQFVIFDE